MKKIILIISAIINFLLITNTVRAQAPTWTWAKQVGDTSVEAGTGITTDSLGNVYVVGYFATNSIVIGTSTLTNAGPVGNWDFYIVKYDAAGNVLWSKGIGGTGNDISTAVATDKSGNVYVGGSFSSPALNLGIVTLTNTGNSDPFLAKYDTNGNLLWAKSANGKLDEDVWALCVDGLGNAIITGRYTDSLTIGSYLLKHIGTMNGSNIFTAKFDGNGNILWAKGAGGSGGSSTIGSDIPWDISADGGGNVYIPVYSANATFTFGTTVFNYTFGMHALLLKYDASGTPVWIRNTGDLGDFAAGVVADAAGNAYMLGTAGNTVFTVGTTTLATLGYGDIFIVKFDALGNVVWAKLVGGSATDGASAISIDMAGDVYVTGYFKSPSVTIGSTVLTRIGIQDALVAKFDSNGNILWATSAYGNEVLGNSICVDRGGDVYITGQYNGSTSTFGSTILNNAGNYDAFVAKLSGPASGIKENSLSNSAFIYPNPFANKTTIQLERYVNNVSIQVYNVIGQNVRQLDNLNGQNFTLSGEGLENGLYFVRVLSDKKILSENKILIAE
jgi:hypothetical protein